MKGLQNGGGAAGWSVCGSPGSAELRGCRTEGLWEPRVCRIKGHRGSAGSRVCRNPESTRAQGLWDPRVCRNLSMTSLPSIRRQATIGCSYFIHCGWSLTLQRGHLTLWFPKNLTK